MYSSNVLIWFLLPTLVQCSGTLQKDIRTDIDGNTCTAGLLKYLPDSSYSASSVLRNDTEFQPYASVVESIYNIMTKHRAWCPAMPVTDTPSEWLQVDFNSTKIITNIFTLGRDGGNYGEFVKTYYFDYQREDGIDWYRYRDSDHGELIKGNNDARNPARTKFAPPIIAKRIRIIPINDKPNQICLKIILYGCNFNDGVVEYRIPRGDMWHKRSNTTFDDNCYDGTKYSNNTWLQGGMGKLMDNLIPSNGSTEMEMQKFFVAWDQRMRNNDHVELQFRFDTLRKFRAVYLYPAIASSLMLIPFSSVSIEFLDKNLKTTYNKENIKVPLEKRDDVQFKKVSLHDNITMFIKMKIFFSSRWMGLTEIMFYSEPLTLSDRSRPLLLPKNVIKSIIPKDHPTELSSNFIIHTILVACFIVAFLFVVVLTIACFLWVRQRKRRRYKSKMCDYRSMFSNGGNTINTISGKNPLLYGQIDTFGPNSSSIVGLRYIHPTYPPCQEYRPNSSNNSNEYEPIDSYWPKLSQQNGIILSENTMDHTDKQTLVMPMTSDGPHNTVHRNKSGLLPIHSSYSTYSSPSYDTAPKVPDLIPLASINQDIFAKIIKIHKADPLEGLMGTTISIYQSPIVSSTWIDTALSRLSEINATSIKRLKKISEGEVAITSSGVAEDCNMNVVVAQMKQNAISQEIKYAFFRQCLAIIKEDFSSHPNLLPVIGRSREESICQSIIYEYPSQINVIDFFQKLRQIPTSNDVSFSCSSVSQNSLLFLMRQLADALSFLDEAGVVHRDVAARNCSIGDRFHLLFSDFAIGLDEFQDDYNLVCSSKLNNTFDNKGIMSTVRLPLLWMPWEAIIMGQFSSKSDVWSFGVTIWEIFTECQLKPYSTALPVSQQDPSIAINNSILIANCHPSAILPNGRTFDQSIFLHDKDNRSDISKRVRDVMHICWKSNPSLRPNFQTLFSILCDLSPDSRFPDEYETLQQLIS